MNNLLQALIGRGQSHPMKEINPEKRDRLMKFFRMSGSARHFSNGIGHFARGFADRRRFGKINPGHVQVGSVRKATLWYFAALQGAGKCNIVHDRWRFGDITIS